jgi:peptidoglycan-N-acetylglucosamine deacetylase
MSFTQAEHVLSTVGARIMIAFLATLLLVAWPVGAASAASDTLAKVVYSGPRSSGAVALTFDDGWGESSCESIARTLRQNGAKGTFFINGVHIKADPARWRRILKDMPVANHTRSHRNLATASSTDIYKQIRQNERLHERLLGRPMLKLLRPPYGAFDREVQRVAAQLGYRHLIMWSVSAADTSSAATVSSVIRRTTGARPGSIILMHCGYDTTARALPTIISHYQARGIEMVGLDELLGL